MRKSSKLADVDNLRKVVAESISLNEVRDKLGYKESGGMYVVLRRHFALHNIDVSHFEPTWNKGRTRATDKRLEYKANRSEFSWDKAFCYGSSIVNGMLFKRLVLSGKREYKCEECGCSSWNGKPLRLQLDHKNGDRVDCREENLAIVCANCHSQTSTFGRGKRKIANKCPWWHQFSNAHVAQLAAGVSLR